jgi:hypothetical protein
MISRKWICKYYLYEIIILKVFMFKRLLSEGRAGETWEPSKKLGFFPQQ